MTFIHKTNFKNELKTESLLLLFEQRNLSIQQTHIDQK